MRSLFRTPPFALVWMVGFLQEVAFFLLVNLPGRLTELGVGESGIGVAYSAGALTALLVRPWFGRVLDVVHRRTVLRTAGLANVASIVGLAVIDTTGPALWAVFLAQRVLQILLFTTLLTYAADCIPVDMRTRGLAIFGLSGLIPVATSNLGGDALIELSGYPGLLLTAAVCGALSWALVWRLPLLPVLGRRPRRSFWAVVSQRDMLALWWITLMFAMAMETIFTFLRTYIDTRGVGTLGMFFAVYGTVAVAVRLGGGTRYDVASPRLMIVAAVLGQAAGLLLLAQARHVGVLIVAGVVLGAAHGVAFPILSTRVVDRARNTERGSAVATFTSIFDIGLLVVAPMVGFGIDLAGYGAAFSVVAGVLAVGAVVFLIWDRRLVPVMAA